MTVTIEKKLDRIDGSHSGIKVTVLKDGAAKMFKRHSQTTHAPYMNCPTCSSQVEHIKVITSAGRYLGKQMYCASCDKKVHSFVENKTLLVAELDGVRVYCDGESILVTKKDLHA